MCRLDEQPAHATVARLRERPAALPLARAPLVRQRGPRPPATCPAAPRRRIGAMRTRWQTRVGWAHTGSTWTPTTARPDSATISSRCPAGPNRRANLQSSWVGAGLTGIETATEMPGRLRAVLAARNTPADETGDVEDADVLRDRVGRHVEGRCDVGDARVAAHQAERVRGRAPSSLRRSGRRWWQRPCADCPSR